MKKVLIILLLIIQTETFSQCVSLSSSNTGSIWNSNAIGARAWTNESNSNSSNDLYTTVQATLMNSVSNYLIFQDFNFNLPEGATVCGIELLLEKHADGMMQEITDNQVRIIKGGVIGGLNLAANDVWNTSDSIYSYGGNSEDWGLGWIDEDIESSSFGIAISVNLPGLAWTPIAKIDNVELIIYYQEASPLPIELLDFNVSLEANNYAKICWTTASELNNDFFEVEKSVDGDNWSVVEYVYGSGTCFVQNNYSVIDHKVLTEETYYRLTQTDFNGKKVAFSPKALQLENEIKSSISIFPNPVVEYFNIKSNIEIKDIQIMNETGKLVFSKSIISFNENEFRIDVGNLLDNGIYIIIIRDKFDTITTKKILVQ